MRIPPRGPRRRIPRWQRGNWKAEKRGKLICRASRGSRGVETGGKEEGRRRRRWRGGRERARIASIDYEARRASLMADSDIYRVNGRRPSIFPRDDLSYYAINTRLSSPRALFSLSSPVSLAGLFVPGHFRWRGWIKILRADPTWWFLPTPEYYSEVTTMNTSGRENWINIGKNIDEFDICWLWKEREERKGDIRFD